MLKFSAVGLQDDILGPCAKQHEPVQRISFSCFIRSVLLFLPQGFRHYSFPWVGATPRVVLSATNSVFLLRTKQEFTSIKNVFLSLAASFSGHQR